MAHVGAAAQQAVDGGHQRIEYGGQAGETGQLVHQLAAVAEHALAGEFFCRFQRALHFVAAQGEQVFGFQAAA